MTPVLPRAFLLGLFPFQPKRRAEFIRPKIKKRPNKFGPTVRRSCAGQRHSSGLSEPRSPRRARGTPSVLAREARHSQVALRITQKRRNLACGTVQMLFVSQSRALQRLEIMVRGREPMKANRWR